MPQTAQPGDDKSLAQLQDAISFASHEVQRAVTRTGELISSLRMDRNIKMHSTLVSFESSFKSEMREVREQLAAMDRKLGAAIASTGPAPRAEVRP